MMLLGQFQFAQPWWFLLVFLLIPLFFLKGKKGLRERITFSSLSVLATLGKKPRNKLWALRVLSLLGALFMGVCALARPQWQTTFTSKLESGIDIVIALDLSLSMEIDDFYPNDDKTKRPIMRIDAAKEVIQYFIGLRESDRIGIVAFSGRPYSLSPITLDHQWLLSRLADLRLGDIKEGGTAVGSAIAAATTRLTDREAKSKVIVLVTDGASNSGKIDPLEAAELSARLGVKIYTIAIGTKDGRVRRSIQNFPKQEFDVTTLKNISNTTRGEFFRARSVQDLRDTFRSINELEKSEAESLTSTVADEWFPGFVGAALGLSFFHLLFRTFSPRATQ